MPQDIVPAAFPQTKKAEGVFPKEKDSTDESRGEIFFSTMASRLTEFVMSNKYVNIPCQKGGVPGVPGCIELTSMIWEAIQRAKRSLITIYEIGFSVVEDLKRKVNRCTRKWLGLSPALSSVVLYSRSANLAKRASLSRSLPASKRCSKRHKEANESRSSPGSND